MTTTNWDCPNGMEIHGTYSLAETVNGKQAWQKSDGVYLRWASMYTQWIFDDNTEDITSVAWKSADASSTEPEIGTFINDYKYGHTCGNNGVFIESLTVSQVVCPAGNKLTYSN